ncbi:unnamed protein product [Protopolystoma xenopodis]|uniref:Uncharacterized protein n=1 Tax=Protopolystoma xenopodis TaxID=117903 RepID=A0A3S5AYU3_9PLAT|nr:unnamed protein product [Protopolystoma xenopodis]
MEISTYLYQVEIFLAFLFCPIAFQRSGTSLAAAPVSASFVGTAVTTPALTSLSQAIPGANVAPATTTLLVHTTGAHLTGHQQALQQHQSAQTRHPIQRVNMCSIEIF